MFLGLDIGTTRLKITLTGPDGEIVLHDSEEVQPDFGPRGEVEIDPRRWIEGLERLLKRHDLEGVRAIGLSGQMHTLVLLDREWLPVRKAIVWADSRGLEEVKDLQDRSKEILNRCGSIPSSAFTLVKLLYLLHEEPEALKRSRRFCLSKDFVGGWLTGNYDTDFTDASATLMLDLKKGDWASDLLRDLGLPDIFPEIHGSLEIRGYLKREVALSLGLKPGIPVIYGAGDQEAAAFGVGVLRPDRVMFSISTGSQILVPVEEPIIDERIHNFRHVEGFHVMGAVQNAGLSLNWALKVFNFEDFEDLTRHALESEIGSNGVRFFPYITPERTPVMSHDVRGGVVNLRSGNTRSDLARAILEGVAMCVYDAWNYVEKILNLKRPRVIMLGGVSKNPVIKETLVSLLDGDLEFIDERVDPSSLGASLMAGRVMGLFEDLGGVVRRFVSETVSASPKDDLLSLYHEFLSERRRTIGV